MKKTSVILFKTTSKYAYENGIPFVLCPKFEKTKEIIGKLSGDIKAVVSQPRNLLHHHKLFAIANHCCNNNIFDKFMNRWEMAKETFNILLDINIIAIHRIRIKYKSDSYALIYIMKYLFLPMEEEVKPSGEISYKISSISFSEMDQLTFSNFYEKCLKFWAYLLEINESDLND